MRFVAMRLEDTEKAMRQFNQRYIQAALDAVVVNRLVD
jgi:hypothetical protein